MSLASRNLARLKQGDFDDLTALEWLCLSNNRLETLPSGVFDKLTALEYLHLRGQAAPPSPPPCQPPGGFPSEADGGCNPTKTPAPGTRT